MARGLRRLAGGLGGALALGSLGRLALIVAVFGGKDCHIPPGLATFHLALATHVVDGARELVLELRNDYSDLAKFDARRAGMAYAARMNLKRWDSVTCRACHKDPQPPGATARAAHGRMRTHGATCIDCHQNLVHEEVPETDFDASLAQGRPVEAPLD